MGIEDGSYGGDSEGLDEETARLAALYPGLSLEQIRQLEENMSDAAWESGRPLGEKEHRRTRMAHFPVNKEKEEARRARITAIRDAERNKKK